MYDWERSGRLLFTTRDGVNGVGEELRSELSELLGHQIIWLPDPGFEIVLGPGPTGLLPDLIIAVSMIDDDQTDLPLDYTEAGGIPVITVFVTGVNRSQTGALVPVDRPRGVVADALFRRVEQTGVQLIYWPRRADEVQALARRISQNLLPARVDLVTVGRMSDGESLGVAVARLLAMGLEFGRCWGSGTGGSPLAVASFLGELPEVAGGASREDRAKGIAGLGQRLAAPRLSSLSPTRAWRRAVGGWSLPPSWVDSTLLRWVHQAVVLGEGPNHGQLGAMRVRELAGWNDKTERFRPGDWLQLVAMDLEIRRPTLMPRHFDEIGLYSQTVTVSELLRMSTGGLDGPAPTRITDGAGRHREITQYPGFWIPWSLEAEERMWPVVVLLPDEQARSSSYWWGLPIDDILKPRAPDDWLVIELPEDPAEASGRVEAAIETSWFSSTDHAPGRFGSTMVSLR